MARGIHDFATDATALLPLRASAAGQLALGGIGLAGAVQPLGWLGQGLALALYGGIGAAVLRGLGGHAPHRRFGAANGVTLCRAAGVALLSGVWAEAVWDSMMLSPPLRWVVVLIAAAALVADGVDGWIARRHGLASAFGARFDMETDALLVLVLALLVQACGQAGVFVLLSGALRYVFIGVGRLLPALQAELPPSWRRKAMCVVQTVLLIVALAPPVPPWAGQAICATGLALLVFSFAADCWALLARPANSRAPVL